MPHTIQVDEGRNVLAVTFSGPTPIQELAAVLEQCRAWMQKKGTKGVLFDFREAARVPCTRAESDAHAANLADAYTSARGVRIAYVLPRETRHR